MLEQTTPLAAYAKNVHSQYGEDGIIEEALRRISDVVALDRWCVEFGAWDGVFLSNTCNLILNKGYKAVLIEGNQKKFAELCRNLPSEDVVKIRTFVQFEGADSLDAVLGRTPIPKEFDFLSIDIDGCDYHVFESLTDYRPKLVCIEYNHTIPNEIEFVQPRDFAISQGSGPKSLVLMAQRKGYELVTATRSNLFFVRAEWKVALIGNVGNGLETFRDDQDERNFLFCGFDGTILSNRPISMPWHGLVPRDEALQQLPRTLRQYPPRYNAFQRSLFDVFLAIYYPKLWRERLARRLFRRGKTKEMNGQ